MSTGIVSAGTWRSEQRYVGAYSGSDPSNTNRGEWWIRTDQTPKTDQVAQLRIDNGSGYNTAPIFDSSVTLGADVYVGKRFKFSDGVVGILPVTDQGGAVGSPRIKNDAGTVYEAHDALELSAIPDSVVSRSSDNGSFSGGDRGISIQSTVDWPSIEIKISSNTSGQTDANIYDSSENLLYNKDISDKSAGDVVLLDYELSANTTYYLTIDGPSDYTAGYHDSASFPIPSSDGQLEITGAVQIGDSTNASFNIVTVGNIS